MTRSSLLACLVLAATACVDSNAPAAPGAGAAPPSGEARQELPVDPPRMAVEPPPRRMPGADDPHQRCDADAARVVVGREATAAVVEEARLAAGAEVVRTLTPGQMVTMEYHPSRLTLDVDNRNVIVGTRCG